MTAAEASASTRTRAAIRSQAQIIDHATVSDRLIRDVLLGWPARADSVRVVLDAARACGVDVGTVPARSHAEVAEWLPKRRGANARPCSACAAKDAELAALRASIAELEAEVARLRASAVAVPPEPLASEAIDAPATAPTAKPTLPPRPEPPERLPARPSARCHVSLEHDGVDLLAG